MKHIILLLISFRIFAFGPDKLLHLGAGYVIASGTYLVSYKITRKHNLSVGIGLLTGIAAGAAKELIWDKKLHRGYPSWGDFNWTAAGSLSATLTIKLYANRKRRNSP